MQDVSRMMLVHLLISQGEPVLVVRGPVEINISCHVARCACCPQMTWTTLALVQEIGAAG
jgi:hypothetical protein